MPVSELLSVVVDGRFSYYVFIHPNTCFFVSTAKRFRWVSAGHESESDVSRQTAHSQSRIDLYALKIKHAVLGC